MRIVNEYADFPYKCMFTGQQRVEKPILDTEHFIDFEGRVYMSGAFLEEAARLYGMCSTEEHARLTAELDIANDRVKELETQLENRTDAIDASRRLTSVLAEGYGAIA